nr:unnamed protein product [Spirometra erinaceieuropaei]
MYYPDVAAADDLPSSEYSAKAAEMEVVEFLGMDMEDDPGLQSVEKCRQDDEAVHLQLGIQLEAVKISHGVLQPAEGLAGFEDLVGHFVVDFGAAGECAFEIS